MTYLQRSIALAASLAAGALVLGARPDNSPDVEPAARRILDSMVRAYREVHEFAEDATFGNGDTSAAVSHLKLAVERPNRILLEVWQRSPDLPEPYVTRFQSDGKAFYTYSQRAGSYTKAKAPRAYKELDYLAVNLEMSALTGGDPATALLNKARSARVEAGTEVDGVPNEVVAIETATDPPSTIRLYVGERDHLLRRFVFEVGQRAPMPGGAAISTAAPTAVYSYENRVSFARPDKNTFAWVTPSGAYLQQEYPSIFNLKGNMSQAPTTGSVMPPGIKPMKVISLQDLMKHARKPGKP